MNASIHDLFYGFNLKVFGIAFSAHPIPLFQSFYLTERCLQNQWRFNLINSPPVDKAPYVLSSTPSVNDPDIHNIVSLDPLNINFGTVA
jgi:hypothetical protein